MIVVLALFAAFMYGSGVALQHREAAKMPDESSVHLGLLLQLIRRPLWLVGVSADFVGFALQAAALARGSLVVVEPLVATSLVFSLIVVAALEKKRLRKRELGAAFLVVGGLSAFIIAAAPDVSSHDVADPSSWVVTAVIVWGLVAGIAVGARRLRQHRVRGAALAVAAGLANGFLAVASKAFAQKLGDGVLSTLASWEPWVLAACGIVATVLIQSAYQADAPTLTFPLIEVTGPLTAAAVGVAMFGEHLSIGHSQAVAAVLAVAIMVVGIVALARDPLLAEHPQQDPLAV
jgi:drug/metabolite transporter (DMT)-like permease